MSSYNSYNVVKLESVLSDVYRIIGSNPNFTEDDILESAASAMSHLYTYKLYEQALSILPVNNHTALLPHYYKIDYVLCHVAPHVINCSCETDVCTGHCGGTVLDYTATNPYASTVKDCLAGSIDTTQINLASQTATSLQVYKTLTSNDIMCRWAYMSRSHGIPALLQIQADQYRGGETCLPNWAAETCIRKSCEYSYSIKGNVLTTSFDEGFVMVVYKRTPCDSEGDLVIPTVPLINEALKAYVLMEFHEKSMNMHEEGSVGLYDRYSRKWEVLAAAAVGSMLLPDEDEWVEISRMNTLFKTEHPNKIYGKPNEEFINLM